MSILKYLTPAAILFVAASAYTAPQPAAKAVDSEYFTKSVQPILAKNCYGCHNSKLKSGDVDLSSFKTAQSVGQEAEVWERIANKIADGTMPPKGMPRPAQADTEGIPKWIHEEISRVELAAPPRPGHVTARRLNRAEYNNTIRDLLGVNFRPADDFPQDDSGYGFDNIGDVLSLSPVLLEKYLKAAETAVKIALHGPEVQKPIVLRSQPPSREFKLLPKAEASYDVTGLAMPNSLHATMTFPREGEYLVRIALEGRRPNGSEPVHAGLWVDGKLLKDIEITAPSDGGSIDLFGAQTEFRVNLPAGEHWVSASLLHLYEGLPASYGGMNPTTKPLPPARDPSANVRIPAGATEAQIAELKQKARDRAELSKVPANRVWVHYVEALGPYNSPAVAEPASRKQLLTCTEKQAGCERQILNQFARRAFRRDVTAAELAPYLKLVASSRQSGSSFEESVGAGLQAILVSPDFLFRIETVTAAKAQVAPISSFALASRLSYFLWSSTPDDQLLNLAEKNTLRQPAVLKAQIQRMLKDLKAKALVENFAGQWLELRRLESVTPDRDKFPDFDEYLRMSMRQETELFFNNLVSNDLSITDLIDAKYSFLNEKLAAFYGIPGIKGSDFRKVTFGPEVPRGGVLTQASILTVSSYATRTSPVLRGKWVLENFLNETIPPPPPNVPVLDEAKIGAAASMRQQMEEHRKNPVCASCHSKMDPIGFGFENYNAIGQWRTKDGKFPIDSTGTLPDGRSFQGAAQFKGLLSADKNRFAECVTDKLLTYALGRGLERYDRRTVTDIARNIAPKGYRFSDLVFEIVSSLPFQMSRDEAKEAPSKEVSKKL